MTTETKVKHTPTPWYVHENDNRIWPEHVTGGMAATHKPIIAEARSVEDAEFIVRRVNAHDDLVVAAKEMFAERMNGAKVTNLAPWALERLERWKAAIDKAEGK